MKQNITNTKPLRHHRSHTFSNGLSVRIEHSASRRFIDLFVAEAERQLGRLAGGRDAS